MTGFILPFYIFLDVNGGAVLNYVLYTEALPGRDDVLTMKAFIMPGIGAGYRISDNFSVSLFGSMVFIMFDNNMYSSLSLGLKAGLSF
jgi:hypothetical protein